MDKRKNLRNPDILPFDYISILLNWRTSSPVSNNNPTLTVSKVLKGTFPFGANILSVTAVDNSSIISFVFQSPFDINTSPWQFELELGYITTISKFRPTAVYNGSNNQITIKFNTGSLSGNTSYPVVFTAKRYRPTAQYLAQLATASQSPVTISSTGQTTTVNTPVADGFTTNNQYSFGYYFTAPSNFTITNLGHTVTTHFTNVAVAWEVEVLQINAALPTANATRLYYGVEFTPVNNINVSIPISNGSVIGIFTNYISVTNNYYNAFTTNVTSFATTINGISVTLNAIRRTPLDLDISASSLNADGFADAIGTTKFSIGGNATWSNIIY